MSASLSEADLAEVKGRASSPRHVTRRHRRVRGHVAAIFDAPAEVTRLRGPVARPTATDRTRRDRLSLLVLGEPSVHPCATSQVGYRAGDGESPI